MNNDRLLLLMQAMSTGFERPEPDVVRRVEILLGSEEFVYVDVRHTNSNNMLSGEAVILTPSRVVKAEWSTPRVERDNQKATASVETWPRRSLTSAAIESNIADDMNSDACWMGDWGAEWPRYCVLTLWFEGRPQSLMLPLSQASESRKQLRAALPELLADLDR